MLASFTLELFFYKECLSDNNTNNTNILAHE